MPFVKKPICKKPVCKKTRDGGGGVAERVFPVKNQLVKTDRERALFVKLLVKKARVKKPTGRRPCPPPPNSPAKTQL